MQLLILAFWLSAPLFAADYTWDCEYWLEHLADVELAEENIHHIESLRAGFSPTSFEYNILTIQLMQGRLQLKTMRWQVQFDIELDDDLKRRP